jgi:hypothetical protein
MSKEKANPLDSVDIKPAERSAEAGSREARIEALRKQHGISRAHAASIVDAEAAAANKQQSLAEAKA